jgi:hypothetical protein
MTIVNILREQRVGVLETGKGLTQRPQRPEHRGHGEESQKKLFVRFA